MGRIVLDLLMLEAPRIFEESGLWKADVRLLKTVMSITLFESIRRRLNELDTAKPGVRKIRAQSLTVQRRVHWTSRSNFTQGCRALTCPNLTIGHLHRYGDWIGRILRRRIPSSPLWNATVSKRRELEHSCAGKMRSG